MWRIELLVTCLQLCIREFPSYGPIVRGPTMPCGKVWPLHWGGTLSDRSIACICVPIYPIGIVTNTTVWHIKAGPLV